MPFLPQPSQFILACNSLTGTKYAGLHTQWLGLGLVGNSYKKLKSDHRMPCFDFVTTVTNISGNAQRQYRPEYYNREKH